MYPLSGTPDENEPVGPTIQRENQDYLIWIARFLIAAWLTIILWQLYENEGLRLHVLHGTTKALQSSARFLGGWALLTENAYNEYVGTLH